MKYAAKREELQGIVEEIMSGDNYGGKEIFCNAFLDKKCVFDNMRDIQMCDASQSLTLELLGVNDEEGNN